MKKIITLLLVLVLSIGLMACGKSTAPENKEPETPMAKEEEPAIDNPSPVEEPEEQEDDPQLSENPITVMDAAMYRGEIMEITQDGTQFLLAQYEGTNYGQDSILLNVDEGTRYSHPLKSLTIGDYVEVFYGRDLSGAQSTEPSTMIGLNYLGKAEERIYNGTVTDISIQETSPETGTITMSNDKGEMAVNFANDGTTQIYMNLSDIKVGEKLSVYHKPMVTASMPPQLFAEEIRPFAE